MWVKINTKLLLVINHAVIALILIGCSSQPTLKAASYQTESVPYVIGSGDEVSVFVWGNEALSRDVLVRPDGKITTPLVEDMQASGNTPSQLARELEKRLKRYIKTPIVTVIVTGFVGRFNEQVRVIGEASEPRAFAYREKMTLLDVMIAVGGLTEFASGNNATLVRVEDNKQIKYQLRIEDLIQDGDISANVDLLPGDVIIIPESWL